MYLGFKSSGCERHQLSNIIWQKTEKKTDDKSDWKIMKGSLLSLVIWKCSLPSPYKKRYENNNKNYQKCVYTHLLPGGYRK